MIFKKWRYFRLEIHCTRTSNYIINDNQNILFVRICFSFIIGLLQNDEPNHITIKTNEKYHKIMYNVHLNFSPFFVYKRIQNYKQRIPNTNRERLHSIIIFDALKMICKLEFVQFLITQNRSSVNNKLYSYYLMVVFCMLSVRNDHGFE